LFRLMLAPLEGYTDSALRTLCFRHGADLTFTEMAHVESFLRGSRQSLDKIAARDATPVQIQLLSGREDHLEQFLSGFKPFTGFMGFNLNLSCPSPDVIRHGKGAAMIKRVAKTNRLVSIIKNHGFSASVKIRLGTNTFEKEQKVYLNSLRGVEVDFFVVHAKTAAQGSAEKEDYSVYPECVEAARGIPVIANGGIDTVQKAKALRDGGVAGVMVGRAALSNPAIFDDLRNGLGLNDPPRSTPGVEELRREYEALHSQLSGDEAHRDALLRTLGRSAAGTRY